MFDSLTGRLSRVMKTLRGEARLTESNIQEALREVRVALLEADVALPVVRDFVARVREKALGEEVIGSLTPGQAAVGVVYQELVALMGEKNDALNLATQPPAVILLDLRQYHLDVTVDEVDVASLAAGQPVSITVDALPGLVLDGVVDRIAPTATTLGGLANYTVRLALAETDASLRAGMSATAAIRVAEVTDAVLVPNWAIRRDRRTGQAYASLQRGEALVEVPITTGLRGEAYTEVLEGAAAGEVAAVSTARDDLSLLGGSE